MDGEIKNRSVKDSQDDRISKLNDKINSMKSFDHNNS